MANPLCVFVCFRTKEWMEEKESVFYVIWFWLVLMVGGMLISVAIHMHVHVMVTCKM